MGREHRIIAALADTAVPVPTVIGLSPDDSVNGAPFYVMDFVDGPILRNDEAARQISEAARATATTSMIDVLADIHAVDLDAVGLADLGRHDGYIERQLKRWQGQWEKTKTRELPVIDAVHDRLAASVPRPGPGDHRPRRLPPRQLHPRHRRPRPGRARLGAVHAGRPAGRRRPALHVLDRARRHPHRLTGRSHHRGGLRHPRRPAGPLRARPPGGTSARSTTTSPSASGSWPASARACSSATRRA